MLKKFALIFSAPVLSLGIYLFASHHQVPETAARMAAVVIWVAVWWLTEAVHLGVTSLVPVILMPLLGILKTEEVAMQYMDQIIFLFIGGFFIAYAMEKWGLHERLAYRIILLVGNKPSKVLGGVMFTAYFISMWVSNTATVMILIAAVLAIVKQKEIYHAEVRKGAATAILIGLSFSATIGGMATVVGTPPNMIFAGMYAKTFPDAPPVDFLQWMTFGVPFSLVMLLVCFLVLKKLFIPAKVDFTFDMSFIRTKHNALGKMIREEKTVLAVFTATILLWFFRDNLNFGFVQTKGWSFLFGEYATYIKDSTVVVCTSLTLFFIPSSRKKIKAVSEISFTDTDEKKDNTEKEFLLEWRDVEKIPLSIILLFGAGFAVAEGFETSGLNKIIAENLHVLHGMPLPFIIFGIALLVTLLSEFASNTASIQLVLPVIIPLAQTLGVNPLMLMLTATFSASLGYMLPVATAANTIVYGSGEINAKDMMRAGIFLDIIGVILITLFMTLLGNSVFGS